MQSNLFQSHIFQKILIRFFNSLMILHKQSKNNVC